MRSTISGIAGMIFLFTFAFVLFVVQSEVIDNTPLWTLRLFVLLNWLGMISIFFVSLFREDGEALYNIKAGLYKVFCMHVGNHLGRKKVLLILKAEPSVDMNCGHLFYEFPQEAFEGEIIANANKLQVTQNGPFKKLRLEKVTVVPGLPEHVGEAHVG